MHFSKYSAPLSFVMAPITLVAKLSVRNWVAASEVFDTSQEMACLRSSCNLFFDSKTRIKELASLTSLSSKVTLNKALNTKGLSAKIYKHILILNDKQQVTFTKISAFSFLVTSSTRLGTKGCSGTKGATSTRRLKIFFQRDFPAWSFWSICMSKTEIKWWLP